MEGQYTGTYIGKEICGFKQNHIYTFETFNNGRHYELTAVYDHTFDEEVDLYITYSNEVISEREELREENVKHFLLSDGTSRAVVYEGPVHYLDNGAWRDIDNTLSL